MDQRLLYEVARRIISCENLKRELKNVQSSGDIVNQLSPGGNSLLHAAAYSGAKDITEYLAQNFPHLISLINCVGDTALHSAIRAGKVETTEVLITNLTSLPYSVSLLRKKNKEGNTVLHEVVIQYNSAANANNDERKRYHAVAGKMVGADPFLAYISNNKGKSPLCLAVKNTDSTFVECLLDCPLAADCQQLPEGKSPVHVAIKLKKKDMLSKMLCKRPNLIDSTNGNGRKALHCAASVGNMEAIEFLLKHYPQAINQRDNEGYYALHVACESGYVKAFNKLLNQSLDTSDQCFNNKRQSVLHIAAKNGRDHMVRYIVKDQKLGPQFVNAEDIEGNTPLHLAAMHGHSLVVATLLLTRKCDSQILNQKGLTAYGVAEERAKNPMDSGRRMGQRNMQINEQCNVQTNEQTNVQREDVSSKNTKRPDSIDSMMALSILFLFQQFKILRCHHQQHQMKRFRNQMKMERTNKEDIKNEINVLIVVATIIATIAFQAITQLPKNGNRHPAPALAPALFSQPTPFQRLIADRLELIYSQIFTFFVSLSMNLSMFAATTLCWVQLLDFNFYTIFIWLAKILVGASLYSICIAFGFTMLIGIKEFGPTYAIATIVFEALFIPVLTVFTTPLFIPLHLKYLFVRVLYVAFFIGYFIVHRLLDYCLSR